MTKQTFRVENAGIADVVVYCDEPNDRKLFEKFRLVSPLLSQIPVESLRVYPQGPAARERPEYKTILPLFECDRPDYIVTLNGEPVLVVEMTEHAYTGDNGLQRFVRVAAAAEQRVPFIYFGPLARTRDDELDRLEENEDPSKLSKRSLTSDFFEGMLAVRERFGSPQLYVEWLTANNGKVCKLSNRPTLGEIDKIYGELIQLMEAVLRRATKADKPSDVALIRQYEDRLAKLATAKNTLFTNVKFDLTPTEITGLLEKPSSVLDQLDGYFSKGKADKLLALHAIKSMRVEVIRCGSKVEVDPDAIERILYRLASLPDFKNGAIGYYTGYKWRSDPHSGVAINIYYRLCLKPGSDPKPLIIFYPRVSVRDQGTEALLKSVDFKSELGQLFVYRYGAGARTKFEKTIGSDNLYSTWETTTKQGRIFARYSTLVFCSDGIILGSSLSSLLE